MRTAAASKQHVQVTKMKLLDPIIDLLHSIFNVVPYNVLTHLILTNLNVMTETNRSMSVFFIPGLFKHMLAEVVKHGLSSAAQSVERGRNC